MNCDICGSNETEIDLDESNLPEYFVYRCFKCGNMYVCGIRHYEVDDEEKLE